MSILLGFLFWYLGIGVWMGGWYLVNQKRLHEEMKYYPPYPTAIAVVLTLLWGLAPLTVATEWVVKYLLEPR